ncbi:MAG: CDP-alcohol phosphatidyltransferase family protein [Verrucomicrobiota bacterium]
MITFASHITLLRILVIPIFVSSLFYYSRSAYEGELNEMYRYVALITFLLASIFDILDGFIARAFKQESQLGAILDPLADKALMLSAIITLNIINIESIEKLPPWFTALILCRDLTLILGFLLLYNVVRHYKLKPHWSGKLSTIFQITTIIIILLPPQEYLSIPLTLLIWTAGIFTAISVCIYLSRGLQFIKISGYLE